MHDSYVDISHLVKPHDITAISGRHRGVGTTLYFLNSPADVDRQINIHIYMGRFHKSIDHGTVNNLHDA